MQDSVAGWWDSLFGDHGCELYDSAPPSDSYLASRLLSCAISSSFSFNVILRASISVNKAASPVAQNINRKTPTVILLLCTKQTQKSGAQFNSRHVVKDVFYCYILSTEDANKLYIKYCTQLISSKTDFTTFYSFRSISHFLASILNAIFTSLSATRRINS